ncbi:MAG: formyltransferase family protein, partial [Acidimicrobiia bacterium]|nr:formyltransferase family protein [Acidimicrobiia bacterium]
MISTVFLGTPAASVAALEAARQVSEIRLVVTQPDRARGRSRSPVPPAIKVAAEGMGLAIAQPVDRRELLEALSGVGPVDVGIIVAFGRLLRADVLAVPRRGFVNIHFSLLPRWRGAAPVERAILAGDRESGATLMAVDPGLDTGPTISNR